MSTTIRKRVTGSGTRSYRVWRSCETYRKRSQVPRRAGGPFQMGCVLLHRIPKHLNCPTVLDGPWGSYQVRHREDAGEPPQGTGRGEEENALVELPHSEDIDNEPQRPRRSATAFVAVGEV